MDVIGGATGDSSKCQEYVTRLKELACSSASADLPYEVLYGRAGVLYALLFVGGLVPGGLDEALVEQVVTAILDAGQRASQEDNSKSPLMFTWHGKRYLGAAHGLAGILTVLLQVPCLPLHACYKLCRVCGYHGSCCVIGESGTLEAALTGSRRALCGLFDEPLFSVGQSSLFHREW